MLARKRRVGAVSCSRIYDDNKERLRSFHQRDAAFMRGSSTVGGGSRWDRNQIGLAPPRRTVRLVVFSPRPGALGRFRTRGDGGE